LSVQVATNGLSEGEHLLPDAGMRRKHTEKCTAETDPEKLANGSPTASPAQREARGRASIQLQSRALLFADGARNNLETIRPQECRGSFPIK
jgi:hypothetical protein